MLRKPFFQNQKKLFPFVKGIVKLALIVGCSIIALFSNLKATSIGYATFLGGKYDYGYDIAVTENGEAIVTGMTSTNLGFSIFPTTSGSYNPIFNGMEDIFVTKFTADGSSLVFSTFIGGSDSDFGYGISVENGEVFLTGQTYSANFPTQNAYDVSSNGGADCFITKLSANGNALEFSTFLGGSGNESGFAISVENQKSFVTGFTQSNDFPTQNAFDSSFNAGIDDVFVTKLSVNGDSLEFSTFLGGLESDRGFGISVENGNAFVIGKTPSIDFPIVSAFDSTFNGGNDVFLTKLSFNGNALEFSTFLGGSSNDIGYSVFVENGVPYITGTTSSTNFPTQNALDLTHNGLSDVFVTKFNSNGNGLNFSTFLGGSSYDYGCGITVDNGTVWITGETSSSNFPIQNPTDSTHNLSNDIFLSQLNSSNLEFSTFVGGQSGDYQNNFGNPVKYKNGSIFFTGVVGEGFPNTTGAFDEIYNGPTDATVVRFDISPVRIQKLENQTPSKFTLEGNYPNPFNPNTTIKFSVEEQAEVSLKIMNLKGEFVKELVRGKVGKGSHSAIWNGTDSNGKSVASGVYFARLESEGISVSKKLTLLK